MGKIQHPTCNQQKHPWSCDELSWSYKEVPYYLSNQSAFWHIGPSFATSKKRTAPRMLNTMGVSSFHDLNTNNTRILVHKTCILFTDPPYLAS